ncbi:HigA family addiction module antitoxin [Candidatus Gracilibacteria bacterium]|jgi:addiction module HigA family antidote|nr:HigA family addiction module antitoxin [Candidatus Gracilibacteria bacterium]
MTKKISPITPGEILMEEFMKPFGISQYKIAKDIGVSARRINEIVHGERVISADTALRFSKYFTTSAQFWLNLQSHYNLEIESEKLSKKLDFEIKPLDTSRLVLA